MLPFKHGEDHDFYSTLRHILDTVNQEQTQLRLLVYEFARWRLRKNLSQKFEDGDLPGVQREMQALEVAIAQLESERLRGSAVVKELPNTLNDIDVSPTTSAMLPTDHDSVSLVPFTALSRDERAVTAMFDARYDRAKHKDRKQNSPPVFWWSAELITAMLVGFIVYISYDFSPVMANWLSLRSVTERTSAAASASTAAPVQLADVKPATLRSQGTRSEESGLPLPQEYGVYAVSEGQLVKLDLLPLKVPDRRVALSAAISVPSGAHLKSGEIQFVVFRRDLSHSAPDNVEVRVVARVVRALDFDSNGKPSLTPVENTWVVRSNAYQMRVSPIAESSEMVLLRSGNPIFAFPAGRYALTVFGLSYDFTVDGPEKDLAHCLERTDALNSAVYSECRNI